jgi:hypothetical protein
MLTAIVVSAAVTLRDSFQRMYARNGSSFEYDITEMTFSTGYIFLSVIPCVRLLEYRKVMRFINDWGNLQVTRQLFQTTVTNYYHIHDEIKIRFNLGKKTCYYSVKNILSSI